MLVVPEGGSLFMHNMTHVVDGHTGIEHSIPLSRLYDDVVQLWSQTDVGYTPTLVVAYGGIWGENYWYSKTDVYKNERLLNFVPKQFVAPTARRSMKVPEEEYNHIRIAEMVKKLSDAGVAVQVGAHGQREGLGSHWEMWMMEQGGMTPLEAIRAATWNGARYLGMQDHIGSIETGKLADLVIIEGNPLVDLRATEHVVYTVLGGRVYDSATMTELGGPSREPYWFHVGDVPLVVATEVSPELPESE
jgi:imidazolonepropionase-like amidohydrolase